MNEHNQQSNLENEEEKSGEDLDYEDQFNDYGLESMQDQNIQIPSSRPPQDQNHTFSGQKPTAK